MLWLAGLMGMMVLGSLAVFGTHDSASDDAGDDVRPEDSGEVADEVSSAFGLPGVEFGDDGTPEDGTEDGAAEDGAAGQGLLYTGSVGDDLIAGTDATDVTLRSFRPCI